MSRTYSWDDTYCPKGHGDWVFIPSSGLHSDIYWCEACDCFYYPIVKAQSYEQLNKSYYSDRASELIKRAEFLRWKDSLCPSDMPIDPLDSKERE